MTKLPRISSFPYFVLQLMLVSACARERATPRTCEMLLDRLIELELHEQGFRDWALAAKKKAELHRTFAADLLRCKGRPIRRDARSCIERATGAEEVSHQCLQ